MTCALRASCFTDCIAPLVRTTLYDLGIGEGFKSMVFVLVASQSPVDSTSQQDECSHTGDSPSMTYALGVSCIS
eukprot:7498432-Alexandrium_andersonii.AAC.1